MCDFQWAERGWPRMHSDMVAGRHPVCRGKSDRGLSGGVLGSVGGSSCCV